MYPMDNGLDIDKSAVSEMASMRKYCLVGVVMVRLNRKSSVDGWKIAVMRVAEILMLMSMSWTTME